MFSIRQARWLHAATLVAACWLAAGACAAEKLTASDRRAIATTIRLQLDAFGRDDAERAFGFATPEIQRLFGTSGNFLRTVRDRYDAVYRPAGVRFVRLDRVDGDWVQTVQITDSDGKVWRALFTMQRQADRAWKVGGCQLLETRAIET